MTTIIANSSARTDPANLFEAEFSGTLGLCKSVTCFLQQTQDALISRPTLAEPAASIL